MSWSLETDRLLRGTPRKRWTRTSRPREREWYQVRLAIRSGGLDAAFVHARASGSPSLVIYLIEIQSDGSDLRSERDTGLGYRSVAESPGR